MKTLAGTDRAMSMFAENGGSTNADRLVWQLGNLTGQTTGLALSTAN
jgi:hypothetical protein